MREFSKTLTCTLWINTPGLIINTPGIFYVTAELVARRLYHWFLHYNITNVTMQFLCYNSGFYTKFDFDSFYQSDW